MLVLADQLKLLLPELSFCRAGEVVVLSEEAVLLASQVGLVLGYLVLEVLQVHFDLLLEPDVAADGRLQLLGLSLKGLVVVDADEVAVDELEVVVDQVVGHQGLVSADFGVLQERCQSLEVELGREHVFEGVEEEVAGALENLGGRVGRFLEDVLELLEHYYCYLQLQYPKQSSFLTYSTDHSNKYGRIIPKYDNL